MSFFTLTLGAVGFIVTPLLSLILGTIPLVTYSSNLTPRLSTYILNRLTESNVSFYLFISELTKVTENIRMQNRKYEDIK
jgi:hypothetical protein